ncbi:DUF2867 domain-containing protein [Streptomyces sp. NPDC015184]|uniref:DUF2867 domain-containing protein n=1 Tax=Streptomyces sp. NPDC015184 TaxID=3364946 RepID=UPI00370022AC
MNGRRAVPRSRHVEPDPADTIGTLGRCDHIDAVAVDVPQGTSAHDFVRAMLGTPPASTARLLRLRDALVRPFGLKGTDRSEGTRIEEGGKAGPLHLYRVGEDSVVAGKDDKHLGYRSTFKVRPGPHGWEGVVTTVVRFHGCAGRAYFAVIKPFHVLILYSLARHGAAVLAGTKTTSREPAAGNGEPTAGSRTGPGPRAGDPTRNPNG